MRCPLCTSPLVYVHGHAACVNGRCPMFGANQAECCTGETAESCPAAAGAAPRAPAAPQAPTAPPAPAQAPRRRT